MSSVSSGSQIYDHQIGPVKINGFLFEATVRYFDKDHNPVDLSTYNSHTCALLQGTKKQTLDNLVNDIVNKHQKTLNLDEKSITHIKINEDGIRFDNQDISPHTNSKLETSTLKTWDQAKEILLSDYKFKETSKPSSDHLEDQKLDRAELTLTKKSSSVSNDRKTSATPTVNPQKAKAAKSASSSPEADSSSTLLSTHKEAFHKLKKFRAYMQDEAYSQLEKTYLEAQAEEQDQLLAELETSFKKIEEQKSSFEIDFDAETSKISAKPSTLPHTLADGMASLIKTLHSKKETDQPISINGDCLSFLTNNDENSIDDLFKVAERIWLQFEQLFRSDTKYPTMSAELAEKLSDRLVGYIFSKITTDKLLNSDGRVSEQNLEACVVEAKEYLEKVVAMGAQFKKCRTLVSDSSDDTTMIDISLTNDHWIKYELLKKAANASSFRADKSSFVWESIDRHVKNLIPSKV